MLLILMPIYAESFITTAATVSRIIATQRNIATNMGDQKQIFCQIWLRKCKKYQQKMPREKLQNHQAYIPLK